MAFVNRSGGEQRGEAGTGEPPLDWDPEDPDATKVHYDLCGWTVDQRAELSESLANASLVHTWDGEELVVPEEIESLVDALFERLEAEIGPFAVGLNAGETATEFRLDEWPPADLDIVRGVLIDGEVPHRWEGSVLFVAVDATDEVDDLLDAVERGDIASFSDEDTGVPEEALGRLYSIGDRLARDPSEGGARFELLSLMTQLDPARPPFGVAVRTWAQVLAGAQKLVEDFEGSTHDPEVISAHGLDLRTTTRPFV